MINSPRGQDQDVLSLVRTKQQQSQFPQCSSVSTSTARITPRDKREIVLPPHQQLSRYHKKQCFHSNARTVATKILVANSVPTSTARILATKIPAANSVFTSTARIVTTKILVANSASHLNCKKSTTRRPAGGCFHINGKKSSH